MGKPTSNLVASVRQRLTNVARSRGEPLRQPDRLNESLRPRSAAWSPVGGSPALRGHCEQCHGKSTLCRAVPLGRRGTCFLLAIEDS